jgi:hypothetical protein
MGFQVKFRNCIDFRSFSLYWRGVRAVNCTNELGISIVSVRLNNGNKMREVV